MTHTETMTVEITERAEEYLASLDNDVDDRRKEELQQEIESGEERYERLTQEHGEDHNLTRKAEKILDRHRDELQELEELQEQLGTARNEFLQQIADAFDLTEEWLQSEVIEAVTHALYGRKESGYKLFGEEIQGVEDLEEFDEFDRIERAEVVILLAKDGLGESERVNEQWQRLKDSKSFAAFEVLAEGGSQTSEEVAEKLDEKKGTVNNWLKNPINRWDRLIPFYRPQKGEYDLSTTGQCFYKHFHDDDLETSGTETDKEENEETEEESGDGPGEEQATLGATTTPSNESEEINRDQNESEEPDISDIEDTEEKADAMFSKVSDKTDN